MMGEWVQSDWGKKITIDQPIWERELVQADAAVLL